MPLFRSKTRRVIPGFGLSLGYTVTYLSLVVLLPLSTLFVKSATMGWARFWEVVTSTEVMSSYRMSFGASALAGLINVFIGFLVAWVLARYQFFGKRVLDAIIDLPFALPTAVAGIALTTLYSEKGWVGQFLTKAGFAYPWPTWVGFDDGFPFSFTWYSKVALAPLGVVIALTFVGLPFVVRTVQPVLEDLGKDVEEAAASLGASRWKTFWKVILPQVRPALVAGFTMAFARGLGEYGSVLFISGNLPNTEIAPHQIIAKLEQYDYAGATAIAVVLLVASFVLLLVINVIQKLSELKVSVA
jgi:sulfate transport system permease protein